MPTQNKKPADAKTLLDAQQGWIFLDVRSEAEFQTGHPAGAWNIPLLHRGPMGMTPNADFATVVQKTFKSDVKLVVGCASGIRSLRACDVLESSGYAHLVNLEGGFMGSQDDFGRAIPGWAACGLPVEKAAPAERTYAHLLRASG